MARHTKRGKREWTAAFQMQLDHGLTTMDELTEMARSNTWAWEFLAELDPQYTDRIPKPKRNHGNDALANFPRNMRVLSEILLKRANNPKLSQRGICRVVGMRLGLPPETVRTIWKRNLLDRSAYWPTSRYL